MFDAGVATLGRPKRILQRMRADGLDPAKLMKIFLTHAHPDHDAGIPAFLTKRSAPVEVGIHADGASLLLGDYDVLWAEEATAARGMLPDFYPVSLRLVKWFLAYTCGPRPRINANRRFRGGEIVRGLRYDVQVIHTPGHVAGHACFFLPKVSALIVGDLIDPSFDHKASLNFPSSDFAQIYQSIASVSSLKVDYFCSAHGHDVPRGIDRHRDICEGTLKMLDLAKARTIELLQTPGGMRLKDFSGKFPIATWMLQDQRCVPYAVFKMLEREKRAYWDGQRFFYSSP